MSSHRVINDFLPLEMFRAIQEFMLSSRMPWYFNDHVVYNDLNEKQNKDQYQFVHMLYKDDTPKGIGIEIIAPILAKLNVFSLIRVKANMTPIREKQVESAMHFDDGDFTENKIPYTVAVLYLNTNNGYTILEDGTKIQSVANRLVLMSGNVKHAGAVATDDMRAVINFNFINEETLKLYATEEVQD